MRYDPLSEHLSTFTGQSVTLTYDEIEALLGRKLPPTAYGQSWRQWWANTETHSQALAWLRAGWRVSRPDLANRRVEFRRDAANVAPPREAAASASEEDGRCQIVLSPEHLTPSAFRMLEDAAEETKGDLAFTVAELINRASMARRRQLLDWFSENAPRGGSSSVTMIREDRDAR